MNDQADKKVVLLSQPVGHCVTPGASDGYWASNPGNVMIGGKHYGLSVMRERSRGSLATQNFNALWCTALNLKRDHQVDYFAMLHSDIEPQPGWLGPLIQEMESCDLDVLSVVSPIKSAAGLTSCALARDDGSTWRVHCRLTMTDVYNLPPTFTSEDVGRPLLINTGCWVCRLDMDWAPKAFFTVNDRIVLDANGKYMAEVEPEDWFFSRVCHELGLKIGATTRVQLGHEGAQTFLNDRPWGDPHDAHYVSESPIERKGIRFPFDVDGWLLPQEGHALADFAANKRVLEIGSYCGRSTICLAQTAEQVISVDPHDGSGTIAPKQTLPEFTANIERYGVSHKVTTYRKMGDLNGHSFDAAFVDGDHSLDAVRRDIADVRGRLVPGGLIAFHDYAVVGGKPGVVQAVNELLESGGEMVSQTATVAVVRPPALVMETV